jgi:hypothetical protein
VRPWLQRGRPSPFSDLPMESVYELGQRGEPKPAAVISPGGVTIYKRQLIWDVFGQNSHKIVILSGAPHRSIA